MSAPADWNGWGYQWRRVLRGTFPTRYGWQCNGCNLLFTVDIEHAPCNFDEPVPAPAPAPGLGSSDE